MSAVMRAIGSAVLAALLCTMAVAEDKDKGQEKADRPTSAGDLVVVMVKDQTDAEAKVGDLVRFSVRFPIVPGGIVSDLKVEVMGEGLSKVAVVRVPLVDPDGKPIVGAGDVSFFAKADKMGTATVKVTPDDKDGKTFEIKVKVSEREKKPE